MVHSRFVLVLCLRVIDCDVSDWIDLPELTSIQMGHNAFRFKYQDDSTTLIMRSAEMNENWLTRLAQTHITQNLYKEKRRIVQFHILLSSSHHSREWFSSTMKWCLDMPSLTDVYLPEAFAYKNDVTITGSTHFILLSQLDIGALQSYFNWSPRGTWLFSLCHTSHSSSCESPLSLCKHFTHILTTLVAYIINVCRIVGIADPVHSPKPFEIDISPIQ